MITITGVDAAVAQLQRIVSQFPATASTALLTRVEIEVRSREKVSQRKPLDIVGNGFQVTVAWPYAHEGGEGTYLTTITDAVGALMIPPLSRDLVDAVMP